jgi:delta 1-pyrroline-5-carboxylate dehydrogenase
MYGECSAFIFRVGHSSDGLKDVGPVIDHSAFEDHLKDVGPVIDHSAFEDLHPNNTASHPKRIESMET